MEQNKQRLNTALGFIFVLVTMFILYKCTEKDQMLVPIKYPNVPITVQPKLKAALKNDDMGYYFSTLRTVNHFVNKNFEYKEDQEVYGVSDYWAKPDEFRKHHGGDCEDFAIFKREIILESKLVDADEIRFLLVQVKRNLEYHMVLVVQGYVYNNYNADDEVLRVDSPKFLANYQPITWEIPSGEVQAKSQ